MREARHRPPVPDDACAPCRVIHRAMGVCGSQATRNHDGAAAERSRSVEQYAVSAVAGVSLFSRLAEDDSGALVLEEKIFTPGQDIITQGEPILLGTSWIYVLKSGRAEVLEDGRRVNFLSEGQVLGERALQLHLKERSATVRCIDVECRVICIGIRSLEKALGLEHELVESNVEGEQGRVLRLDEAQVIDRLRAFPLLTSLSDAFFARLARQVSVRRYAPGELVLRKGEQANEFFLLDRGKIGVLAEPNGGTVEGKEGSQGDADADADVNGDGDRAEAETGVLLQAFRGRFSISPSKQVASAIITYFESSVATERTSAPTPPRAPPLAQSHGGSLKATLRAGQFFGESALLPEGDGRRNASVVALTHVTLLVLEKGAFTDLMRRLEGFKTP